VDASWLWALWTWEYPARPVHERTLSGSFPPYGPGRYDPQYEEDGIDYPVGYVRWTEKRNTKAFLELLASGAVYVSTLIEKRCPVEQGSRAYEDLKETRAYTVLLEYPTRALLPMPARSAGTLVSSSAKSFPKRRPTGRLYRRGQLRA
jgi:hypothetical protein